MKRSLWARVGPYCSWLGVCSVSKKIAECLVSLLGMFKGVENDWFSTFMEWLRFVKYFVLVLGLSGWVVLVSLLEGLPTADCYLFAVDITDLVMCGRMIGLIWAPFLVV